MELMAIINYAGKKIFSPPVSNWKWRRFHTFSPGETFPNWMHILNQFGETCSSAPSGWGREGEKSSPTRFSNLGLPVPGRKLSITGARDAGNAGANHFGLIKQTTRLSINLWKGKLYDSYLIMDYLCRADTASGVGGAREFICG